MARLEETSVVERELIVSIAAGDSAALADLYARLRDPLAAYLTLFVRDPSLREEVIQDTFLAVWNGAGRFRGESSARSWVFGIARRRAIDALRREKTPVLLDIDGRDRADRAPGPEQIAIASFEAAEIRSAIERIAAIHQEVLMLIFTQGLSYAETAEVLAVPVGTVKSRLNHARKSLRNELGAQAGERHDR
jgi:RNA polymerase sigma factor (sigma-70 family)